LTLLCAGVFRHLEWDHDEHSIVMKSTHCKPQRSTNQAQRNAGQAQRANGSHSQPDAESALMALVVMSVWPLQFTALIEIHKKVSLHM